MAKISESELRDFFFENPKTFSAFLEEYWQKPYLFAREVTIGSYGRIDLLWLDVESGEYSSNERPTLYFKIFELKEGVIDLNAVGQISRYKKGIERAVEILTDRYNVQITGYLIGREYANGDVCYVVDSMNWVSCYFYTLNLDDGLNLSYKYGWKQTDEGSLEANFISILERHYEEKKKYLAVLDEQREPLELVEDDVDA